MTLYSLIANSPRVLNRSIDRSNSLLLLQYPLHSRIAETNASFPDIKVHDGSLEERLDGHLQAAFLGIISSAKGTLSRVTVSIHSDLRLIAGPRKN